MERLGAGPAAVVLLDTYLSDNQGITQFNDCAAGRDVRQGGPGGADGRCTADRDGALLPAARRLGAARGPRSVLLVRAATPLGTPSGDAGSGVPPGPAHTPWWTSRATTSRSWRSTSEPPARPSRAGWRPSSPQRPPQPRKSQRPPGRADTGKAAEAAEAAGPSRVVDLPAEQRSPHR
ncbi:hypothetical protein GXW82_04915 [Streptacidiphilus sp. 4-A2]|nr:hypothetical protein [Streptacidiphilus sp. 4-A2]